jgi:uncharacterized membrane protein HdeD (DUF308 family)
MASNTSFAGSLAAGLDKIHDSWGWFVTVGVAFIALGVVCIVGDVTATKVSVLTLGWLLVVGAAVALVQSFRTREWSGFFLYFATALLRGVAGYLLIRSPAIGEVVITILLASLFIVGGIFRAVGASTLRFPSWGWMAFSGAVSVLLGFMLIFLLPTASLWFIGFLIGVDFIIDGVSLIVLGMAIHHVPAGRDFARA